MATEHLLAIGRRRIVFVGDIKVPEFRLRHKGYVQALERAPAGTAKKQVVPTHMTAEKVFESMRAFIGHGEKFDGVVCATDIIAINVIRALNAHGLQVPEDVSVVGYDDLSLAAQTNPPLTTIRQDIEMGAQQLVELLFRRIDGEATQSIVMAPELIIRESTVR